MEKRLVRYVKKLRNKKRIVKGKQIQQYMQKKFHKNISSQRISEIMKKNNFSSQRVIKKKRNQIKKNSSHYLDLINTDSTSVHIPSYFSKCLDPGIESPLFDKAQISIN
ncbi:hypothetical protein M0811_04645 [Anaeramoeba ignava]|uniref:Transposase n=1 Tax=Anaeramoeba ignava TaxID=1746090 RepID=A0A9Q0LU10_ANAIG|nr:hypothetical protein M0811_04645 [Anaeramoeba ignava]